MRQEEKWDRLGVAVLLLGLRVLRKDLVAPRQPDGFRPIREGVRKWYHVDLPAGSTKLHRVFRKWGVGWSVSECTLTSAY